MFFLVCVLFLLAGCSAPAPSCSAGVMVLGPLPLPYVDCGVTSEPEEDDDLDV